MGTLRCPACFSVRRNSAGKCVSYVHKALVTFPDIQRVLKPNPDSFCVLVLVHEDSVTTIECTSVGSALRKRDRYLHNAVHSVPLTRTCVCGIIGEALNGHVMGGGSGALASREQHLAARTNPCPAAHLRAIFICSLSGERVYTTRLRAGLEHWTKNRS